jgi:hypothetical protein
MAHDQSNRPDQPDRPASPSTPAAAQSRFNNFYRNHFLPEHTHPANVALHVFGTVAGIAFAIAVLASSMPCLVLLFPIIHAAPGLVGHRLFERNAEVGDVRVLRTDFSSLWFIAANHVMTFDLLRRSGLKLLGR